jgi:hypothetical protein
MARPHFKIDGQVRGAVLQMMTVPAAFWKRRAVSCGQHCLFLVLDEYQFTAQDVNELVFVIVPVPL